MLQGGEMVVAGRTGRSMGHTASVEEAQETDNFSQTFQINFRNKKLENPNF